MGAISAKSANRPPREVDALAGDRWTPGPARPLLGEDRLDVWRVDLTAVDEELGQLLCAEERARAERIPRMRERRLWVASRGVLRTLLGAYLQTEPRALRFVAGAHGKPALLGRPQVSFNLSHSGDLALYAVSSSGAVGIDVELGRRSFDPLALARRAFGPAAARRLGELAAPARKREFLRLWTRHEAAMKCRGTGIGAVPDACGWEPWVVELDIGPRALAAVASRSRPRDLRSWDWRP